VFFFFLCKPKLREVERETTAVFLSFWVLLLLQYQLREKQKGRKERRGLLLFSQEKTEQKGRRRRELE
jgi:hypothetical protein